MPTRSPYRLFRVLCQRESLILFRIPFGHDLICCLKDLVQISADYRAILRKRPYHQHLVMDDFICGNILHQVKFAGTPSNNTFSGKRIKFRFGVYVLVAQTVNQSSNLIAVVFFSKIFFEKCSKSGCQVVQVRLNLIFWN